MSEKKSGKRAKKQLQKTLNPAVARLEKNKAQMQERMAALTILQAKTKLTTELENLKKTNAAIDIQDTIKQVDGKNATRILNADDAVFSDMDSITALLKNVRVVEEVGNSSTAQNGSENAQETADLMFPLKSVEVMAFVCAINETPKNPDEEDETPDDRNRLSDFQISLSAKILRSLKIGEINYQPGKTRSLIVDTEAVVKKLMISLLAVRKSFLTGQPKLEEDREKVVPPTEQLYSDGSYVAHNYYVKELEKHQSYKFEFIHEDALISDYTPRAMSIIKRPCLMIQWAIEIEPHLKVQFRERQRLQRMIEKGKDAFDRLNSLSQVVSFLAPSYDKKRSVEYNEMTMMLHVIRDQFARQLKPTDTQLAQIAKMKDVELKRRAAAKQSDLDAMIKNFEYIDIQIAQTRSKHRTARYYFYLIGYIEAQCNIMTEGYRYAQTVMSQQLGILYNSHAKRFGLATLPETNAAAAPAL